MAIGAGAKGRDLPVVAVAGTGLAAGGTPARDYLVQVMNGLPLSSVPDLLQGIVTGMLKAPVYRKACEVLSASTREERAQRLANVPESIRELVQAEAKRLWAIRTGK